MAATVLAIYKPFGPTPYGARTLAPQRTGSLPSGAPSLPWTSAWLYGMGAAAMIGLLLLLLHHLSGSQVHH